MQENNKRKVLMKNTFMLYLLTFSDYFFGLVTIPYLTRVLGATNYGIVGMGQAFGVYIQLFMDFGFIIFATAEVARVRTDKRRLNEVFSCILYCKIILGIISGFFMLVVINCIPFFMENAAMFMAFWIYMVINSFIPDFLYRGIEKMESVTVRSVIIKGIFTLCIFLFVKNDSQYLLVPVFYSIGALIALAIIMFDVFFKIKIRLVKVEGRKVLLMFKNANAFFFSRIATTVYSSLNMLVLGKYYSGQEVLGFYSASERLLTAGRAALSPISDSLYPYMIKEKDINIVKKILIFGEGIIFAGCVAIMFIARPLCQIIFGQEYGDTANILRVMIPSILLTLPTYILGFPVLTPLGKEKYANISNIVGACVQAAGMVVLIAMGYINVYSVCILTSCTESVVLIIRIIGTKKGLAMYRENCRNENEN